MKEHKHAEVLRALADGVPLSEFEIQFFNWGSGHWLPAVNDYGWMFRPDEWEVRRKPQYIMVNGFKVPKPLEEDPGTSICAPTPMSDDMASQYFYDRNRRLAVERGIAHATKEAAIAHAKAMLGIDPKWEE